ncbi:MAG TPA: monovalent cation/H+ antiporter complex subunit F [Candidatus Dormibacteraeota bacterium]|jgi:multicomponent Na+:H+ antiporter subunit F|nr:monovalent cation/H+ antiporter complex subunit F [Candidatus Dormibacteraeota bacterium]
MTAWTAAASVLLAALLPVALVVWRRAEMDGVVALELGGVVVILLMLLLAEAYGDPAFADLAVVLALLSLGSGLVFVRFLERWI